MAPLLKTVSLNPFRFWPPKPNPLAFLYFRPQNLFLLWLIFRATGVKLLEGSLPFLKQLHHGQGSRMVVSNHISFIDPHIMFELNFKSPGLRFHWLAGVEPFESPFLRWHMQGVGAFSIDRGMVDTRTVSFAQSCLNKGERPLLLFPEGEASYQPTEIAPFFSGAALMALQAQHYWRNTPGKEVTIYPATMLYRFVNNPTSRIRVDAMALYHRIHRYIRKEYPDAIVKTLPHLPPYLHDRLSTPELLRALVYWVVLWAEQSAIIEGFQPNHALPLEERLTQLQQWLYQTMINEHLPDDNPVVPDTYDELMSQKNRLRSILVRKRFTPTLPDLNAAINRLANSGVTPAELSEWELEVMGFVYPDEDQSTRLERLTTFLETMRDYATAKTNASEADMARWVRQTEETRVVKLISLILSDLDLMQIPSDQPVGEREWLIWDGLLLKCELMTEGTFVYRPLKRFDIQMHPPFTVTEFAAKHPNASRRELITLMTDALRDLIKQPLMGQRQNSACETTSAVQKESVLSR